MEHQPKTCKKTHRKHHVNVFNDLLHIPNQSSLSSTSDLFWRFFKLPSKKSQGKKGASQRQQKHDYLTRLFERKKLKEKSLSKKVKTPFDRKLSRTCWPIDLSKVSKIKKKPSEKRKGKPTYKSLMRKKFSNPTFITSRAKKMKRKIPSISSSGSEFIDDESFGEVSYIFNTTHFLYEPVTPQMLINVLQDSEHLKSGATTDMIITKLRTLKLDLNPSQELLKEEVLQKLYCAIKLGLVKENNGQYKIADSLKMSKLPRRKINSFWEMWYRRMQKQSR